MDCSIIRTGSLIFSKVTHNDRAQSGAALVETALVVALISMAVMGAVVTVGVNADRKFCPVVAMGLATDTDGSRFTNWRFGVYSGKSVHTCSGIGFPAVPLFW